MGVKEKLLAVLEENRADVLSGEALAQRLGVTRAAVSKAVGALRNEGLAVEATPGVGYRLLPESDLLSQQALQAVLPTGVACRVMAQSGSTNQDAKVWAVEGAPHGAMVMAGRQDKGRGRMGRTFGSPEGGIYMSIVLRPDAKQQNPVMVTTAAAVAVCEAVQHVAGIELGIKWVNDLFYGGKKCCGILTEAGSGFETGRFDYIVVGIGLNYASSMQELAPEVAQIATSLFAKEAAPLPRAQMAAEIYKRLLYWFDRLDDKEYLQEYRRRSIVLGKEVKVLAAQPYMAVAEEIDADARLVVRCQDGKRQVLSSGEISVRL